MSRYFHRQQRNQLLSSTALPSTWLISVWLLKNQTFLRTTTNSSPWVLHSAWFPSAATWFYLSVVSHRPIKVSCEIQPVPLFALISEAPKRRGKSQLDVVWSSGNNLTNTTAVQADKIRLLRFSTCILSSFTRNVQAYRTIAQPELRLSFRRRKMS